MDDLRDDMTVEGDKENVSLQRKFSKKLTLTTLYRNFPIKEDRVFSKFWPIEGAKQRFSPKAFLEFSVQNRLKEKSGSV